MRRKTSLIPAGFALVLAAASGCDDYEEIEHCVNGDGVVVEEQSCAAPNKRDGFLSAQDGGGSQGHYVYHPTYHPVGSKISGGSLEPSEHATVVPHTGYLPRNARLGSNGRGFGGSGGT